MKPKSTLRSFLALAGSSILAVSSASASTLYWDGLSAPGAPGGGAGTWSTAVLGNWDTTQSGHTASDWVNLNLDTAVFGGTAGAVALNAPIVVGGLRFDTTGYGITATSINTLSFGDTTNTILFNNGIAAATITGTVAGAVNKDVVLSNAANHASQFLGTLTLNGTSTGGWSGSTTINSGMTLALAGSNQGLLNTSAITLNGGYTNVSFNATQTGGILLTNTSAIEAALNRVSDSAAIISNGGFITVTNTASATTDYSETMGALDLRRGQLNVTQTNANTNDAATQILTFGSGSLTTVNGAARTNATTSAINFSGATLGVNIRNTIFIDGQATTNQNEIIAPWVTYGGSDYAVYNRAGSANASTNSLGIQGAAIAATAQSGWSTDGTTGTGTLNNTLTLSAGTATQLTATRNINTLRNTGGTAQNITSIASNVLTVTGSAYANGDVVVTGTTFPTGLARETAYYVVNASGTTFQLAATPGGPAITGLTHVGSSPLVGGIRLSSGNNLETYGILNGSTTPLVIGGATGAGVLSTPTGGGNLYLTTGNTGNIVINAPITDAPGGAAVTVVKSGGGNGMLILSGNNTFTGGLVVNSGGSGNGVRLVGTQSFTGGITLNGGGLGDNNSNGVPSLTAASLNGNAITVNGPSHLMISDNQTLATSSTITINATGVLNIGGMGATGVFIPGVVSGSGVLDVAANNVNNQTNTVSLTHSTNTFSGNVIYTNGNGTSILNVNSIGDSGKVVFGLGGTTAVFALNSTAAAGLTLNTRQLEIAGNNTATSRIQNNSAQTFTINTDLLTTGTGNRTLELRGGGAGLSTFNGVLANGSLTSLAITKADAGTWALTKANTYTGATTITGGTLQIGNGSTTGSLSTSSAIIITSPGTLAFNRSNAVVQGTDFSGAAITGTGSLLQAGSDTLTLNVANTFTGTTTVTGGRILMTHASALQYSAYNTNGSNGSTIGLDVTSGLSSNTLTLGGLSGSVNLASAITAGYTGTVTNLTLNPQSGTSYTYTGAIANATTGMTVTKNNAGTQLLHGNNSYTGGTILNAGAIEINNANSLGTGTITFAGTATIQPTHSSNPTLANGIQVNPSAVGTLYVDNQFFNMTFTGPVTGSGTLIQANGAGGATGSVTLSSAANTFTGILQLAAPAGKTSSLTVNSLADSANPIRFTSSTATATGNNFILGAGTATPLLFNSRQIELASATGTAGIYNNNGSAANTITINTNLLITANGAKTLLLGGSNTGANTFAGTIGNSGAGATSITKADGGLWMLSNTASTYTGVTTISAGTLQVSTLNNGGPGNNSSIGASTNVAGNLVLNGGTLRYTGGAVSTDRLFSLQTSSTIDASGTGAVNFNNIGAMGFNTGTAAKTLTLTGTNTGNNTIAAVIGNNTGTTAITKTGIGTWVLSGANTNTGATTISGGGTLILEYGTDNNTKLSNTAALNLTNGGGNLILNNGSHTEVVGSTSLGATGSNNGGHFSITSVGGTSKISLGAITRANSFTGLNGNGSTLSIGQDNLATTTTANFNGILSGAITVGSNFVKNDGSGNIVALSGISAGNYTNLTAAATTATDNYQLTGTLTRTGATMNSLRIVSNGDDQFLDLGSNQNLGVGTSGAFSSSGGLLYVGGAFNNYTIKGTGTSTISNQNNTQETIFTVFDGTLNIEPRIGIGNGVVTKSGNGTLVLKGASVNTGPITVNQGVVRLENAAATGTTAGGVLVYNNAALELGLNNMTVGAEALAITGTGVSNAGALRNLTNITSTYQGAITIGAGGARINSDTSGSLTLTGGVVTSLFNNVTFGGAGNTTVSTTAISGAGGLVKDGAGTTTLSATNTYTGNTTVSNGKLVVNGSISTSPLTTVQNGGTLGGNANVGALTIDVGGTLAPGNSPGTTTVNGAYIQNGTLLMEIGAGTTPGNGGNYDQVVVNGSVTLTGLLSITMNGSVTNDALFFILVNDSTDAITGTFSNALVDGATFTSGGQAFQISYFGNQISPGVGTFTGGNDVVLMAIPEPNVAALLGGLGTLMLLRRRR